MGGIRAIYVGVASDSNYTADTDPTAIDPVTGEIVNLGGGVGTEVELYKFENTQNQGTAVETIERDVIVSFNQAISAIGRGFSADAIKAINFMAKGEMFAIVHYNSGVSRLYGQKYYLLSSGGENTSGEGSGDSNSFTIELAGVETDAAPLLQGSTTGNPFEGLAGGVKVDGEVVVPAPVA